MTFNNHCVILSDRKVARHLNWNKDKSIMLSQICLAAFALSLLALDIGAYWVSMWFFSVRAKACLMMVTIYAGSIFGWIFLYRLWTLLANIREEKLFTQENVEHMRASSWCCFAAAIVCAFSAVYYFPFVFIFIAAGFVGLIIRIVKNAFQQAIAMKDELDFTV